MAARSVDPRSPTRLVSSFQPPEPPQQEINEKVRDAFENLELSNIPLSPSVYSANQQSCRPGRSHARVSSPGRERSRGRQPVRMDRSTSDREWDEKRGLGLMYGVTAPVPGPSSARPQHACPGTIQAPVRSSSLTSASFTRSQSGIQPACGGSSFALPPPYSTLPGALPHYPNNYSSYSSSVRRMLLVERIRPWLPFLAYGATVVGFALAIAFWRDEVFGELDELARWLRAEEEIGYAVMFFMIFLTCIPPVPLYSTLQILSGYTFGAWTGAVVSYFSALAGALFVFSLSRSIPSLRSAVTSCMSHSRALQRVVRAISRRPSLLFLVRLAPYPYNVLNALLAGCPRLTFRTYASCTALSLLKVIIHTSVGAGIKNFAEYHSSPKENGSSGKNGSNDDHSNSLGHMSSIFGIVLCVALAIYLMLVARRAVDEELEDDDDIECGRGRSRSRARADYGVRADDEESAAFLSESRGEDLGSDFAAFVSAPANDPGRGSSLQNVEMAEREDPSRLRTTSPVPLSSLSATPYGPPEWSQ
ncbi:uncharacterized protein FOMMEDRAFT_29830 [Fomitiporia mediterranea MF3/22]|uniref:uncharacterized protein n=1 Tax=Fomitiporia mediterranea (strain MF3/22) TaxID=694068 RepID=UPI00044082EC|nr:uncharacterized protein FOMMEDRAFT_29830 [Fomitiporia mediterranea MF3/22]EJD01050.1 hypothetical protein FOMMEDRAFT_29830 [Fomitiporia mediterranea MF3/22]